MESLTVVNCQTYHYIIMITKCMFVNLIRMKFLLFSFQNQLVAPCATIFSPHFHIRRSSSFHPQAQSRRLGRKRDLLLKCREKRTLPTTPPFYSRHRRTLFHIQGTAFLPQRPSFAVCQALSGNTFFGTSSHIIARS